MNLSCRGVLVALLIGTLGCHDPFEPIPNTQVGSNLVRLTVSASASEVVRGSPVTIRATLTNDGTEAITLHFRDTCQILPYIRNTLNEIVLPADGSWGCGAMLTELALTPGQSVTQEFVWMGGDSLGTQMPLFFLPTGRYLCTVEVPALEVFLRASVAITLT